MADYRYMDVLLFLASAAGYLLYAKQQKQGSDKKSSSEAETTNKEEVAASSSSVVLDEFPWLLSYQQTSRPILGLLFAASWCDDCWEVVPLIEKVIRLPKNDIVEIVYISSDRSQAEMQSYQPDLFSNIPFDQTKQRSDLKRYFGVCAKKEMDELGITPQARKSGTPTLILVDIYTGRILTETGVDDVVDQNPFDVLKTWKALL